MSEHEDHEGLADELEQQSDRLKKRSDELGEEISDVHDDWERKRADDGVPGAVPRTDAEKSEPAEDNDDDSSA